MMDKDFIPNQEINYLQNNLCIAMNFSHTVDQHCTVAAIANEVIKGAKKLGLGDLDTSALLLSSMY